MLKKPILHFDDAFSLLDKDLSSYRYIIFIGESGSGKSSYISWLHNNHKNYKNLKTDTLAPHMNTSLQMSKNSTVLTIDELLHIGDFISVSRYIFRYEKYLIASHLPSWIMWLLRIFGKTLILKIDGDEAKIQRYLTRNGYKASGESIRNFVRQYRANYTDLDIILETSHEKDFDTIYKAFHISHKVEFTPRE